MNILFILKRFILNKMLSFKEYKENLNNEKISWISCPKSMCNKLNIIEPEYFIGEDAQLIEEVKGMKVELYNHQKTSLKCMVDLENNRKFQLACNNTVVNVSTSAGVLSEPVGSGKTPIILSLILYSKIPNNEPIHTSYMNIENTHFINTTTVTKKFKNILDPTIIFVGISVLNQWIETIKTFTNLKIFVVRTSRDLQKLITLMEFNDVNKYDIVLVKNGTTTSEINLPSHVRVNENNLNNTKYIYNIIANMNMYCWARVVIDDFDTISLPPNTGSINGLFTWFVSATMKRPKTINSLTNFKKTSDFLLYNNYHYSNIMKNNILFYNCNIRSNENFIKKSTAISTPRFFLYKLDNINFRYNNLISLFNDEKSNDILQMVNEDAMNTAAKVSGSKSSDISDIFKSILGNKFSKYDKTIKLLQFIEKQESCIREELSEENKDDVYSKNDLLKLKPIKYNYPNINNLISNTKIEYEKIKNDIGKEINRIKEKIEDDSCLICFESFKNSSSIIFKCCCILLCVNCADAGVFKNKKTGRCCNCRKNISHKDIIYIHDSFNLRQIIDHNDEKNNEIESKVDIIETDEQLILKNASAKIKNIVNIIKGENVECKEIERKVQNIMIGNHEFPETEIKKVLIFTKYDETISKSKKVLNALQIPYWDLKGSTDRIKNIVNEFNESKTSCVLGINSEKYCAGLNLQNTTDIIFMNVFNENIETQIIGRGQRIGRNSTLKVHYLLYKNEYLR